MSAQSAAKEPRWLVKLPSGNVTSRWALLKRIFAEANRLGVEFRVVGAAIEVSNAAELPDDLREPIDAALADGFLWSYFAADEVDYEATSFLAKWQVEAVPVEDPDQLAACLDELEADLAGDPGPDPALGIDIETGAAGSRPSAIAINRDGALAVRQGPTKLKSSEQNPTNSPGLYAHCSDIQTLQAYAGGERAFVFRGAALRALLELTWLHQQALVAHNATFEAAFLQHHTGAPLEGLRCTMQAAGLLFGVEERGLADTCRNVFRTEPPKALQQSCWSAPRLSPGQLAYAASDAVLAYHLWPRLHAELQSKGRLAPYELQAGAVPAVAAMELRGLGFDRVEHARQVDAWSRDLAEARREYLDITGNSPPTKPAEFREWLESVAGDQIAAGKWPLTPTGLLSIDQRHLKRLFRIDSAKPVLAMMAKEKLVRDFGIKLIDFVNPVTGRIHCRYSIARASSGRFSASAPNIQQVPKKRAKEFRRCFVAAPGRVLVCCDWNQIELRAAAWISGDPVLTAVYENGRDLHSETAASILGCDLDSLPEEQREKAREAAKPVNYGAVYGIGAAKLAEDAFANYEVEMTVEEAQHALDQFFRAYSGLARWREENNARCERLQRVEIGCGRVMEARWEKKQKGHLSFNQHCNLPIQGICADAMLRAIRLVHERLAGLDAGLVACIHDELLLEAAESVAEQAKRILEETMIEAFEQTFPGAPLKGVAEAAIGSTWLDAKPK